MASWLELIPVDGFRLTDYLSLSLDRQAWRGKTGGRARIPSQSLAVASIAPVGYALLMASPLRIQCPIGKIRMAK